MIQLKEDLFFATDAAILRANGSTDPLVVADYNNIFVGKPLTGSIIGMALRYSTIGIVAVNERLSKVWHDFSLWHELAHVIRKHIDDPAFVQHQDRGIFSQPVDSRTIPRHELEANLISAEYCVDSKSILTLVGYNNPTMCDYRDLKKHQQELSHAYDAMRFSTEGKQSHNSVQYRMAEYRHALNELEYKRRDLESEMIAMNYVKSLPEIAREIGTTEVILKYKLEAMRIRGYDIDVQELERYNQVFRDAI